MSLRGILSWGSTPLQSTPVVRHPPALAVVPRTVARGSGSSLLRFHVPTTLALRVPLLFTTGAGQPCEARSTTPSPVPPSGFLNPSAVLAATSRHEPELPRTHANSDVATPRNCAALFHAANVLGINPTELSPLEEPCRLPTAVCSLAGSVSTTISGARILRISGRFHPSAGPSPHCEPLAGSTARPRTGR